jgi:hypothetical protein
MAAITLHHTTGMEGTVERMACTTVLRIMVEAITTTLTIDTK